MGLFGGGNSRSSTSNVYNTRNENDQLSTDEGIIASRGSSIFIQDKGLTAQAIDATRYGLDRVLDFAGDNDGRVLKLYETAIEANDEITNGVFSAYEKAYENMDDNFAKMLGLIEDSNERIDESTEEVFRTNESAADKVARAYDKASKADSYIDPKLLWGGAVGLIALFIVFQGVK